MPAKTSNLTLIENTAAALAADNRVYDPSFVFSPIDTADAGKHKLCDGVQTYSQLSFLEDGGTGAGVTSVNGDTGPAVTLTAADVSADASGSAAAAESAANGYTDGIASSLSNLIALCALITDIGPRFIFDTSTSDSDPGSGKFRFNNATLSSATQMFIDINDADGNDLSTIIDNLGGAGMIILRAVGANKIIGLNCTAWTTASGYRKLTFTYLRGVTPANAEVYCLEVWPLPINTATQTSLDAKVDAADVPTVYEADITGTTATNAINQFANTFTIANAAAGRYTITADSGTPFTAGKTKVNVILLGSAGQNLCPEVEILSNTVVGIRFNDPSATETDPNAGFQIFIRVYA